MFGTGKVHYEVGANTEAMNFGGIALVHRLVTKLGHRCHCFIVTVTTDVAKGKATGGVSSIGLIRWRQV